MRLPVKHAHTVRTDVDIHYQGAKSNHDDGNVNYEVKVPIMGLLIDDVNTRQKIFPFFFFKLRKILKRGWGGGVTEELFLIYSLK